MKITEFCDYETDGQPYFGHLSFSPKGDLESKGKTIAVTVDVKLKEKITKTQKDSIKNLINEHFFVNADGSVLPYNKAMKNLNNNIKTFNSVLQENLSMNGLVSSVREEEFVEKPSKSNSIFLVLELDREVTKKTIIYDAKSKGEIEHENS